MITKESGRLSISGDSSLVTGRIEKKTGKGQDATYSHPMPVTYVRLQRSLSKKKSEASISNEILEKTSGKLGSFGQIC